MVYSSLLGVIFKIILTLLNSALVITINVNPDEKVSIYLIYVCTICWFSNFGTLDIVHFYITFHMIQYLQCVVLSWASAEQTQLSTLHSQWFQISLYSIGGLGFIVFINEDPG